MREVLVNSDSGTPIIDASSNDVFFCCRDQRGQNKSGQIWMQLRERLQLDSSDQALSVLVQEAEQELRQWLPEAYQ